MTIDLAGTALVIGAVCAGIAAVVGPVVTAYLQIKASRKADANKTESMAAREAQTQTIIASAVVPALNTPPPTAEKPDA
jgi:hypothetical protein